MSKVLYLIGSLRNDRIPKLANKIREDFPDFEVFDDWYAAGPEADDYWKEYEQNRGRTYQEALSGHAARNVFAFDKRNLDRCTHAMLVLPAGKSGHMEIMYATYGVGAKTAILLDPTDVRWDVMYQFVPAILNNDEEINEWLNPSSPEQNMTAEKQDLTWSRDRPLKVLPGSWVSAQKNTPPIIGVAASNFPGSLGRRCGTSTHSMTAKTSTRKAR
jgi:hypothetical protein